MNFDTRIAVICFLSYTLNGLFTLTGENKVFIPPVIFEPYILTALALVYAVMSYRTPFAVLFVLLAGAFVIEGFVTQGFFNDQIKANSFYFYSIIGILTITVLFYFLFLLRIKFYPLKMKWLAVMNLIFFVLAILIPAFGFPGWVSHIAGFLQAITGILMLSVPLYLAQIIPWHKRMILLLVMVSFFDLTNYFISIQF